jgi:hypothetical protein
MDGWIKKGDATPDKSRTPEAGLCLGLMRSERRNKTEKDRIKK